MRIGIGYDIHRCVEGRKLFLGGVEIPFDKGLLGHSDADVLLHAVCDALLGAAGEGDIGTYFPNTDEQYKNISSLVLLEKVAKVLRDKGYHVVNIDVVLIAEAPKIMQYVPEMKKKIAKILSVTFNDIGIKATTQEGVGSIGKGEAICAQAIALIN